MQDKEKGLSVKISGIQLLCIGLLIATISACSRHSEQIYGLTVDDSWYETVSLRDIVSSLKKFRVKPTVRIVMSGDIHPEEYVELFKEIKKAAYIMAQPVDSYEMNLYDDVESYKERFREAKKYLSEYVDIWEIGNEINGLEWINQDSKLITEKIEGAYEIVKDEDHKVAVTFYYEKSTDERDMIRWIKTYFPKNLMENIDYSFISYYEDDNEGYEPDWRSIFDEFQILFPNSKVGIGECGNTAADADEESKIEMINKYYKMPEYGKNYIGGYFWWNYVEDCVGDDKVYQAIYENFR